MTMNEKITLVDRLLWGGRGQNFNCPNFSVYPTLMGRRTGLDASGLAKQSNVNLLKQNSES
jgi:hypothetical protein